MQEVIIFMLKNLPYLEYLTKTTKEDKFLAVNEEKVDSIDLKYNTDDFNVIELLTF